jgi:hypothetical protein
MIVSSTSTNAYPPVAGSSLVAAASSTGRWGQPGQAGQREQEPRGDRVELAHVPEGERTQERAERRGRVRPGEDPAHPAVPQQRHVIDAVRAGDHPGHQRGDLQPSVRALVRGHAQVLISQVAQPRPIGQRRTGTSPADDTRFGSSNTAEVRTRV